MIQLSINDILVCLHLKIWNVSKSTFIQREYNELYLKETHKDH